MVSRAVGCCEGGSRVPSGETSIVRLLDEDADRALARVVLYLTAREAEEVRNALDDLLSDAEKGRLEHVHVDDREYEHLTLVLYAPERAGEFQPRWKRLIVDDA